MSYCQLKQCNTMRFEGNAPNEDCSEIQSLFQLSDNNFLNNDVCFFSSWNLSIRYHCLWSIFSFSSSSSSYHYQLHCYSDDIKYQKYFIIKSPSAQLIIQIEILQKEIQSSFLSLFNKHCIQVITIFSTCITFWHFCLVWTLTFFLPFCSFLFIIKDI